MRGKKSFYFGGGAVLSPQVYFFLNSKLNPRACPRVIYSESHEFFSTRANFFLFDDDEMNLRL